MSLRIFGSKPPSFKSLRENLTFTSNPVLYHIPAQFERIIAHFDNLPLDSHFRAGIYDILTSSLELAESMSNPTFSTTKASDALAKQLSVLSRVTQYLNNRPVKTGFSVLIPASGRLLGHFDTEAEAESYLATLRYINHGSAMVKDALVVPVRITSDVTGQTPGYPITLPPAPPEVDPNEPTPDPAIPLHEDDPLPDVLTRPSSNEVKLP